MGNLATTLGVRVVRSDSNRDHPSEMTKLAYMAGLFDGEGCVTYKQYWSSKRDNRPNKYFCWRIQLEIVMTDEATIQWCCDHFGGNCIKKPRQDYKMQYILNLVQEMFYPENILLLEIEKMLKKLHVLSN